MRVNDARLPPPRPAERRYDDASAAANATGARKVTANARASMLKNTLRDETRNTVEIGYIGSSVGNGFYSDRRVW